MKSFLVIAVLMSAQVFAEVDKTENLNGVQLETGKEDKVRTYTGKMQRTYNFPLDMVKKTVTDFSARCNNDFKSKRQYTSEDLNCRHHNDHLVETFVERDIKKDSLKNFSEAYLLGRQVYNRGAFSYYELVTVNESRNEKNQRTVAINLRMLTDDEVKTFTEPKFNRESAFETTASTFYLTEVSEGQTEVRYEYTAQTSHWLLNKQITVPQVFSAISKSVTGLMASIEDGATSINRELASR